MSITSIPNDRITVSKWKGNGRMQSWHNLSVLFHHFPARTEEDTKNLDKDNKHPNRNPNGTLRQKRYCLLIQLIFHDSYSLLT